MRPFYQKGTEDAREIFVKIVITKSVASIDVLIRSPDNTWTVQKRTFDLKKPKHQREYSNFLERNFSSNFKEFDAARRKMLEATKHSDEPDKSDTGSQQWRQEILTKIKNFRQNDTDENNSK